jgi:hypothetical protein
VIFLTVGIAASTTVSSIQYAAAASSINFWAVPTNSRVDDGNFQILRLKFNLDTGNPLEKIRITIEGTPDRILEFNGNGDIMTADDAFVKVRGSISFESDGYMLSKLKGKFRIFIDKMELGPGEYDALAEVIREGGETHSDEAHFKLRAGSSGEPDLKPEFFFAWHNIMPDEKRNAYVLEANNGKGNAGKHVISIYLSENNVLDGGDILVGEKEVNSLKSGKDRLVHMKYELPGDTDPGQAYLIVKLDSENDVDESKENNNTKARKINVLENEEASSQRGSDKDDDDEEEEDDD